jgi:hypothetical protein
MNLRTLLASQEEFGSHQLAHTTNREDVVAFDFDGVLSQTDGPYEHNHFGPPVKEGMKLLRMVIARGYQPVVFTARKETDSVAQWMGAHGFPGLLVTNHKPVAIAYVDDRAIHFAGGSSAIEIFKKIVKRAK